ncbi:MAG: ROK family protein [Fibrobacteres bacterium]|nr:ROK family protein [Fibrobacterota bacterium]
METKKSWAIGVDIGGTTIKCALISEHGDVKGVRRSPTEANLGREKMLNNIKNAINEVLVENELRLHDIEGIGFGTPGLIVDGVLEGNPNLPAWNGTPIAAEMKARFDVPCFVANDVTIATFAEFIYGAGKGAKNLVMFAVGTGIGGGLVINGQLFEGSNGMAGEIGHVTVVPDGRVCGCGQKGCLEAYSSTLAINAMTREYLTSMRGKSSKIYEAVGGDLSKVTPRIVYDCAKEGDEVGLAVNETVCTYLAVAIGGLINTLNPDTIILGGGVMEAGEIIIGNIKKKLPLYSHFMMRERCRLVPALLGENAGVTGCGALVFRNLGRI